MELSQLGFASVKDKAVFITGASYGIGRAASELFAEFNTRHGQSAPVNCRIGNNTAAKARCPIYSKS
jgi:NAD(P)-dependent dehydrogenase (short-subunit alcohol dehydrogenase family)